MRSSVLSGSLSTARGDTVLGSSIAGTIDYAAPEQLGKLPGVKVGFPADVYGFAKTLCFALFRTTEPTMRHYKALPEATADLIGRCLSRDPTERPQSFAEVLKGLGGPRAVAVRAEHAEPLPLATKKGARPDSLWPDDAGDGPRRRPNTDGEFERVPTIDTGTRVAHALMAFFFGSVGVHKFMQGNSNNGGIRLLLLLTCVGLYWNMLVGMVECVQYLAMSNEDYTRAYQVRKKNWF